MVKKWFRSAIILLALVSQSSLAFAASGKMSMDEGDSGSVSSGASSGRGSTIFRRCGAALAFLTWNLSFTAIYSVERTRGTGNGDTGSLDRRSVEFLLGFPTTIVPWALVKEGGHKVFGVNIPD